ncbi:hypothetical protein MTO96_028572 [Rhipicephalus appendiculatus]
MGSSVISPQSIVAILVVQSVLVGSPFLPFGGTASATNDILGFKISTAASLLPMLAPGFTGIFNSRAGTAFADSPSEDLNGKSGLPFPDMVTTTEKTEITVPTSALDNVINFDELRKHQMDLLFALLRELDDRGCVSRIVCESAAGATRFGKLGNVTKNFFNTNVGVAAGPVSVFVAAAETGRSQGVAGCAQAFQECTADLPYILRSVELM